MLVDMERKEKRQKIEEKEGLAEYCSHLVLIYFIQQGDSCNPVCAFGEGCYVVSVEQ